MCNYIYIYTRYVLALIFLVHFPVYSILNSKSEILNGRVLLGKSELETLSCFLFNNLFQRIPRSFRIIQFKKLKSPFKKLTANSHSQPLDHRQKLGCEVVVLLCL